MTNLANPESHPIHRRYAEINVGIRDRGERWAKCPNCGDPYRITPASDGDCRDGDRGEHDPVCRVPHGRSVRRIKVPS